MLERGEMSVSDIVDATDQSQPQVSKHLAVLREVDVVRFRTVGRSRLYRIHGPTLKTVHDWVGEFASHWNSKLDRFDDYLATLQENEETP